MHRHRYLGRWVIYIQCTMYIHFYFVAWPLQIRKTLLDMNINNIGIDEVIARHSYKCMCIKYRFHWILSLLCQLWWHVFNSIWIQWTSTTAIIASTKSVAGQFFCSNFQHCHLHHPPKTMCILVCRILTEIAVSSAATIKIYTIYSLFH